MLPGKLIVLSVSKETGNTCSLQFFCYCRNHMLQAACTSDIANYLSPQMLNYVWN
jgi:hypothetical protein